jgi:hypothetical protein
MRPPRRNQENPRKTRRKPAAFGDYRGRWQRPFCVSPVPPSFPCNLAVETACMCLQRASCCSPATCQLQLVLNTCSRCMDCMKSVVWYNSVLDPLPWLLALICSCRCAFCKDVMVLTAFKNSTRHNRMNNGMTPQNMHPHLLICLCQCITIRHVPTRTANRRTSSDAQPPNPTTSAS